MGIVSWAGSLGSSIASLKKLLRGSSCAGECVGTRKHLAALVLRRLFGCAEMVGDVCRSAIFDVSLFRGQAGGGLSWNGMHGFVPSRVVTF
jgi:hypothetical protein